MSGHSKWHNIQATKSKADAKRANIFTKIGREISVAVKMGGPDPTTNSRLADVIQKARSNNMPNDNISRSIKKASGEINNVNYDSITYEGYGPGGVAFIVECLSDNKNRTAGDVRHAFDKFGGSLGTSGSVSFMFERKGVVVLLKTDDLTEDKVFEIGLDAGAEDIETNEDNFVVTTEPNNVAAVRTAFENAGIVPAQAGVEMVPSNYVTPTDAQIESLNKLVDMLEDLDDVQEVYHNGEF